MRKFLLVFLFIVGCDLQSDNEPKDIFGVWDANPETHAVIYYNVFWWQGNDTLDFAISNMVYQDSVLHIVADSLVSNPYSLFSDYVRFGCTATNLVGESEIGLSDFYSYYDLFRPSAPQGQRVIR